MGSEGDICSKEGGNNGGGGVAENCIMRASLFALLTKYYSGKGQRQRDGQGMQDVRGEQKCIQGNSDKRPLSRHKHTGENNIKMGIKEVQ